MTATSTSKEIRQFWDDDAASYDTRRRTTRGVPRSGRRGPPRCAACWRPLQPPRWTPGQAPGSCPRCWPGRDTRSPPRTCPRRCCRSSPPRPPPAGSTSTPPTPTLPARPGQTFERRRRTPSAVDLPDPGIALAAWRAAAPDGRLALIEGSSGGTGRPVSPRISRKHPANRAAVTDAQNIQLCATGPKTNLLSICGA